MKGGGGLVRRSFASTVTATGVEAATWARAASACSAVARRGSVPSNLSFSPFHPTTRAGNAASPFFERDGDGEVGHGDEALALALALHDDAERDGLDAPGRQAAPDLRPEEVRHLVADEPVDDAARLLRVHAVLVDHAGVLDRARHGGLRDLVELGAVERRLRRAGLQDLLEVPADRLALAVRVGREVDRRRRPSRPA